MKILILYFSYQSTVETVAESIAVRLGELGHSVHVENIQPVQPRGYWRWLLLSFIPGVRVRIRPVRVDFGSYDRICLGFPKWTLSCPPVNELLARTAIPRSLPFGLFMVYGGWDQDRYLRAMIRRVSWTNPVVACTSLKRTLVVAGEHTTAVSEFCLRLTSGISGHSS